LKYEDVKRILAYSTNDDKFIRKTIKNILIEFKDKKMIS
jgi:hypothetical protein